MKVKYFESVKLSGMKRFLYFNLMRKINDCLVADNALGNKFQPQQTAFTTAFTRLDEAMLVSRKSLLTPEIQRLDTQRVQEWRLLRGALRETLKMTDAAQERAADFVLSLFNTHGDVQAMRVNERTGALSNLVQDLTEKYAAQVEATGLAGFAAQLAATNAEYVRLYDERLHEWSEYEDEAVQSARAATDTALENLCIVVAGGIITGGMAEYRHFVDYVNEAIKVAKVSMGGSTSRPEGEDEDVEDEEGEGETTEPGSPTDPSSPSTPSTPSTPNEPSNPNNPADPSLVDILFKFHSGQVEEIRAAAGSALAAPPNTSGYVWSPEPFANVPAMNFRFIEVPEGAELHTVAWYNQVGNPVQWYDLPAGMAIPEPPTPPEGYYWHPYPDVMPNADLDIIPELIRG